MFLLRPQEVMSCMTKQSWKLFCCVQWKMVW
uniref:Uncharacterized protein n=1 Tax=Arundo donax TaxID=35708 RepID=A0A0A9G223_ARUDO